MLRAGALIESTPIDTDIELVLPYPMESILSFFEGSSGYRRNAVEVGARTRSEQ